MKKEYERASVSIFYCDYADVMNQSGEDFNDAQNFIGDGYSLGG